MRNLLLPWRPRGLAAVGLSLCLALLGCGSPPPRALPERTASVADPRLSVTSWDAPAPLSARLVLTRHSGSATPQPVIVYLPGLGQRSADGQRWQAAWAAAGYAVLSVQLLDEDAAAWRSELARTGEFRELGQLHYGPELRAQRLLALERLVAALRERNQEAPWRELDWSRSALAGYETGAQAALDLRGRAGAWQPRAVLAISPQPLPALAPSDRAEPAPALVITGPSDLDPLSLIPNADERRRAGAELAAGPRYLLSLPGLSHAALAGTLASAADLEHEARREAATGARPTNNDTARRGRQGGGGADPGGAMALRAGHGPRSGSALDAERADLREAWRWSAQFFDAWVRERPEAVEALRNADQLKPAAR
jgi:dienelactone hydrolase